jgi:hypothetical protein
MHHNQNASRVVLDLDKIYQNLYLTQATLSILSMLSICMFHPSTRSLAAKVFLTALVLLVIFSVPMLEMPKIQSTEHKPLQPGGRFKLYKAAFWGWLDAVGIPYQSPPRRNVGPWLL